ncbi:MAG: type II/IV secretion system protein [Candidatus Hydrogenedentes bacterium]|nr:type II/IV secretion system protein [Candidatus Hydrogenedentota bacterium]
MKSPFEKLLVADGIVDEAMLAQLRSEGPNGTPLHEVLVRLGHASADKVYRCLAKFCELRFVVPSKMDIPANVVAKVPARFATHYRFVPIGENNGALMIAVGDPLNSQLLDDIRLVLKRRIEVVVATPDEIERATKVLYGVGAETVERILSETEPSAAALNLDLTAGTNLADDSLEASIIKFVNELLVEAIRSAATDVHLEPFEDQLRVRYRIDGILHQAPTPPNIRGLHAAIVSRIKIMANLNIAERRLPQDGKILATLADGQYDLRVSVLPTPHGETVNIRILSRSSMFLTLEQLGMLSDDLQLFNTFIHRPHGMILVTGPTGSGKTTTLYAALSKLNKLEHKIITIEDPIEYQLKGVTQMQVLPQIGFDFSNALRSMLRHDPDIMLVGEVRDYETAEMAIRSSLTGHLVFSTLHTNDAAGSIIRLTDMGVEPYLIASTMIAAIAQRLVRAICEECAEDFQPEPELLREFHATTAQVRAARFRRGRGCDACRNTGYRGRFAIYEFLPFTHAVKDLTVRRAPSTEIKRKAVEGGLRTLRQVGWQRVCEGRTTFEEVLRVTGDVDIADPTEAGNAAVPV